MTLNLWTAEEDQLLLKFYEQVQPHKKWKRISDRFLLQGIYKTVYQCRQRFTNKLDPTIKVQQWKKDEVRDLFSLFRQFGSKWTKIQKKLLQRTQSHLKNKFYSFLRSFLLKIARSQIMKQKYKIHYLPSKLIKRIFQGQNQFKGYRQLLWEALIQIDYQIKAETVAIILEKNNTELKEVFSHIEAFLVRLSQKQPLSQLDRQSQQQIQKQRNPLQSDEIIENLSSKQKMHQNLNSVRQECYYRIEGSTLTFNSGQFQKFKEQNFRKQNQILQISNYMANDNPQIYGSEIWRFQTSNELWYQSPSQSPSQSEKYWRFFMNPYCFFQC